MSDRTQYILVCAFIAMIVGVPIVTYFMDNG